MKQIKTDDDYLHSDLTKTIIQGYYQVYNTLVYGFLEKVYENALMIELKKSGLNALQQEMINVFYQGEQVGDYFADIIVNNLVIIELKAAENICEEHKYQLTNYLRATELEIGQLLNFGKKPEFNRVVFTIPKGYENSRQGQP